MRQAVIRVGDSISPDDPTPSKLSGLLSLFPGISLPFYVTGVEGVAKDQLDLVKAGKDVGFVYAGIVTYYDAFSEPHYTRYCWFFKGPSMTDKDAEWCPAHNDFRLTAVRERSGGRSHILRGSADAHG